MSLRKILKLVSEIVCFCCLLINVLFNWIYLYQVAEVLKDRPSWLRDCRRLQTLGAISTGKGGTIELLYTQVKKKYTLLEALTP